VEKISDIGIKSVKRQEEADESDKILNVIGEEFGGMNSGFGFEYERRLSGYFPGLGVRGGIGIASMDITYTSFPIQFNYLLGNDGNFLELGAGATIIRNNAPEVNSAYKIGQMTVPPTRWSIFQTVTLAYRGEIRRSANQKNMIRIGFTYFNGYGQGYLIPCISFDGCWGK